MKKIKEFIKTLFDIITLPSMMHLPGNLAFFIILSIFPILILIGILASYFSVSIDGVARAISIVLPNGVEQLLLPYIQAGTFTRNIIISTIFAFILASNGTHALILASNSLYDIKNSSYLKRRVKALFLILLLILLFIFMIAFLTYGNKLFTYIIESVSYKPISEALYYFFAFIKWPIAMFIIYLSMKLIYVLSPDGKIYSNTTSKGALFATVGFTVATAIFSFYVNNFGAYDVYYGSIATIVILMIWIYILSYILVIGIAINVRSYNKLKIENMNKMLKKNNNISVL